MQHKLESGLLFAFEGIDGSGKTTIAKRCVNELVRLGYDCIYLKEPTDGKYGKKIKEVSLKGRDTLPPMAELELFLKDRIEDVNNNILPNLRKNKIVILDRYYYSTIAYQGSLGIDIEYIKRENEKIAPKPDVVFFISIPVEMSAKRIIHSRNDSINLFEKEEYLKKVKNIFDTIKNDEIIRIDGTREPDVVFNDVFTHIKSRLK